MNWLMLKQLFCLVVTELIVIAPPQNLSQNAATTKEVKNGTSPLVGMSFTDNALKTLQPNQQGIFKQLTAKGISKTDGKKMARSCDQDQINHYNERIAQGTRHKQAMTQAMMAKKMPSQD